MSANEDRLCRHCEDALADSPLHLCRNCFTTPGIFRLYRVKRTDIDRGPEWEQHLRMLTHRARLGLPVGGLSLVETLSG